MKEQKKKEKLEVAEQPGSKKEIEEMFDTLLEAVVEQQNRHASQGHDAFELYQHHLHSHLHQNLPEFKNRCVQGYRLLLEES